MQQKNCLRFVYKIHTKQLKKANWSLELPLKTAMDDYPECIVSLNESQLLRFIDELNNVDNITDKVKTIQKKIKIEKKKPRSRETKAVIRNLYDKLYELQFQKDYLCVVMDSNKDYDRANEGFYVNGIKFRRMVGTNGGVKNSTIVYVNEELYPELKKRIDCGRDKSVPFVPAKLESYQALVCSGSTPIPEPKGIIVVKDCVTYFKDDIILINDEVEGEPLLKYVKDYDIEHNDSDGYGIMLPSYSKKINEYLSGKSETIAGMNCRYAWTKGMIFTFDFIKFAEQVAKTYKITDIWGDERDVRDADIIITESMLKLWMCYKNWEEYYENCRQNNYQFSVTKTTPEHLENVRNTNYQFLQSYIMTDDEIKTLCKPTIDEITGVLGMDYRKSIAFLAGFGLDEDNAFTDNYDYCTKALMIDGRLINDSFIRRKIWNMISKKIEMAKRGAIKINANFAMISGDPYALCQSIFGLKITGLLKAGEIYHKYWIDRGAKEVVCFRAPMTCHNNIRKMKVKRNDRLDYWYKYMDTVLIYNAWDTACEAMNGSDKDGDINLCTDDPILLKNTLNSPTIICVQRKADKKIVEEEDIIAANKLAFNDEIGAVTNRVTSMIEVQAGFEPNTPEFKTLEYRIMCGQLYQQNTIDRIKGIISKPMPSYWYNIRDNVVEDEDSDKVIEQKEFNRKITAVHKPYFMTYVYPELKNKNNTYNKNINMTVVRRFKKKYGIKNIDELYAYKNKTEEMKKYLYFHEDIVGKNPCIINKICWFFEDSLDGLLSKKYKQPQFDYSILKCNVDYSKKTYNDVLTVYKEYQRRIDSFQKKQKTEKMDAYYIWEQRKIFIDKFRKDCSIICSNEYELCDIVLDICYKGEKAKQFAWDICGDVILKNLLKNNNYKIRFPKKVECGGEFEYCGEEFIMCETKIGGDDIDYIK